MKAFRFAYWLYSRVRLFVMSFLGLCAVIADNGTLSWVFIVLGFAVGADVLRDVAPRYARHVWEAFEKDDADRH